MGHMLTKLMKIIGVILAIPIGGWVIKQLTERLLEMCTKIDWCQSKPDQKIEIIRSLWDVLDTILIVLSFLITIILYVLIFKQVKSQQKSVKMQADSLQITMDDFALRKKVLTSEIVMNALNKFSDLDMYKLINYLKTTKDVGYPSFDHDVLHLLNICESVAMQYYILDLDLYIIDNQLGDMIIEIYDNAQVRKIKQRRQHDGHLYSNIDKFYLTLKKSHDEKNKADSSLN